MCGVPPIRFNSCICNRPRSFSTGQFERQQDQPSPQDDWPGPGEPCDNTAWAEITGRMKEAARKLCEPPTTEHAPRKPARRDDAALLYVADVAVTTDTGPGPWPRGGGRSVRGT